MTREEQIVEAAKAKEKETGFGELVKSPVSRGVNSAYGIGFLEGAEWADEHPGDALLYVCKNTVEIAKIKVTYKAWKFLENCIENYMSRHLEVWSDEMKQKTYDNFCKAMEEQQCR